MEMINIRILSNTAVLPSRGSKEAAGWDLYADIGDPVVIPAGCTVKIGTGISMAIPKGCFGALFARSGMASSRDLAPANKVGVIDSDYRGEILVPIHNHGNDVQFIEPGERIAQLIILPYIPVDFNIVTSLENTERGNGGFGSSGSR